MSSALSRYGAPLSGLDPLDPLRDLDVLVDVIGDARVVGVGESAHGGHEFGLLRHRIVRLCVERLGFSVVALESGFTEGLQLDAYVRAAGVDPDVVGVARRAMTFGMGRAHAATGLLAWLRDHHRRTGRDLHLYGVDVPGSARTVLPALDALEAYLHRWVPEDAGMTGDVRAGVAAGAADAVTAGLAELAARLASRRPLYVARSGADEHLLVAHQLELGRALDIALRAGAVPRPERDPLADTNPRDAAMAASVELLLERHRGERIVVLAHNGHIQRAPHAVAPGAAAVPACGHHLSSSLGAEYVAVGFTAGSGEVIGYRANTQVPGGVEMVAAVLEPAVGGSLDALLGGAFDGLTVVDMRSAARDDAAAAELAAVSCLRSSTAYVGLAGQLAFDAVVHVPQVTIGATHRYPDDPEELLFHPSLRERLWGADGVS